MHDVAINNDGLLLDNRATGVRTRVQYQPDGTFLILTKQDTSSILDQNARLRAVTRDSPKLGKFARHVADVPYVIYMRLVDAFGPPSQNPEAWAKWLNDPDHSKLRIWEGKV